MQPVRESDLPRHELEVVVVEPTGQVSEILFQVVDGDTGIDHRPHQSANGVLRHADQLLDRHLRLDGLEQVDQLERCEQRTTDVVASHDGDLEYADGHLLDATEVLVDEVHQLLVDGAVLESVALQRLRDVEGRGSGDAVDLLECLTRHQHDLDDRPEAGISERLLETVAVVEGIADAGDLATGNCAYHVVPLPIGTV